MAAAAILGAAIRTADGQVPSASSTSTRPRSRRSSGIIRVARSAARIIPDIMPPRFRSSPTPTTAPVPSMNVLP